MIARIVRAIISIIVGIIPLLYLGGYLSAFGLPSPYAGATSETNFLGFSFPFAAGTGRNSLVPIAGFGITGLIIFTVLSRIGSMSSSMISQPRMPDLSQIPLFSGMQQRNIPESLPEDLSKTQFVILRQLKVGVKNTKEIGKRISMDKKDIEGQIADLKAKGYVTKDNKLTTKSMDILY